MHIRPNEINRIAIDKFTSTSGLWLCLLCEAFEPGNDQLKSWHIVILTADTHKVRKIVLIARDNPVVAFDRWEDWKEKFSAKVDYLAEADVPSGLSELKFSMPFVTEEDREAMLKMRPTGARIYVRDIIPIDEVTARAMAANIEVVLAEENKPKPTMGVVLKIGPDPFARELCKEGDIVMYSRHAGNHFMEANVEYRCIEVHEVTGVREAKDGIEDLFPNRDRDSHVGAVGGE